MEKIRHRLLNEFQRNFPLVTHPFHEIGKSLGVSEEQVLRWLQDDLSQKRISRVGPVFPPNKIGTSTLAAMSVPPSRLEEVALKINSYSEVNHNYEREGSLNLWFVITAESETRLQNLLREIETQTGISVHDLRLEEEFRIDLGFSLDAPGAI